MGRESQVKFDRRQVRKAFGPEAEFWAFQCFDVIKVRGFWGRLKWLVTGK